MKRKSIKPSHEIVVPGDILDTKGVSGGENTYVVDGILYASILGVKNVSPDGISVVPISGCYMPKNGDVVIGIINDVSASNWIVDINAPYQAPLHVSEVPWKVEFGDTLRYLNIGDTVLLKVLMVDENKKIQVTMNDSGLRKLEGGQIVNLSYSKVSRVIGKNGSVIQILENMTDCRILIGHNGRIWISGNDESADIARQAIEYIIEDLRSGNLTERVQTFIEERIRGSGGE
ncbi:MAG: exosome complex RNA-binding protein Rrp4 [archaeon]|nr:exosome complex RNA-binding protein Rrp4 [archaeon]